MLQFTHNHVISWGIAIITLSLVTLFLFEDRPSFLAGSLPEAVGTSTPLKENSLVTTLVTPILSPSSLVTNLLSPIVSPLSPSVTIVSPSPAVSVIPRISSLITPTPVVTVTPSPSSMVTPLMSPTPTPAVGSAHVVINEIAWAGTAAPNVGASDEWLELYNVGSVAQELNGWHLCEGDMKILSFGSSHRIEPGAFFLIERGVDDLATDITADFAISFSGSPAGLSNSGEHLTLRDGACGQGVVVDEVGPGVWYMGTNAQGIPPYATMERKSAFGSGTDSSNWATWGTIPDSGGNVTATGLDVADNPIRGTPKFKNSVTP